jgi:hypothetical protein
MLKMERVMDTQVRTLKALQAIQVTLHVDKGPVRATLAREALEAVAATTLEGEQAMYEAFRQHQAEIERMIIARWVGSGKKAVIFWGSADVTMADDGSLPSRTPNSDTTAS